MILKDFSDELIALYEDTEDTKETTISGGVVKNSIVTALTVTDLKTAYELLQKANPDLAKLIDPEGRYRISFANLEDVYATSINTPDTSGLLEFWTVIKLMVESKTDWSGRGMTSSWTDRLVNAFYKPALTEAGILAVLKNNFPEYGFKFNSSDLDEHKDFFSGPGNNAPDFISDKLKESSGRSSKPGTVECKPATATSNIHTAAYTLRYISLYTSGSGEFWFETKLKTVSIPEGFPKTETTAEKFTIKTFSKNNKNNILDSNELDHIYKELCKAVVTQNDHNTLTQKVKDQLDTVNKLEKSSFVDKNYSLKDAPSELNAATKQLHTLINRKAEVAKLLPESIKGQADFMKTYEELSILNEAKVDIDNFINKFGEATYDLFKKSTQRLKNNGISTDLTYHTKHTDKKDLEAILINLQNRAITKDNNLTELAGDYEYLGEGKGYKVYKINDVVASMNLGAGTGWCISGRYGHYSEKNYTPTRSEAEKHWNSYTKNGVQFYFFIGNKNKVALALYPKTLTPREVADNTFIATTNCEIYDERDVLSYPLLSSLPVDLIDTAIIFEGFPAENGLYIENNVLIRCDKNLESVVVPDSVTEIAPHAFAQCDRLKSVAIGNGVTTISKGAFYNCTRLTSVTLNNILTSIGTIAFCACSRLKGIVIPDSVTSIGELTFIGCTGLTSVTFGANSQLTAIGRSVFVQCTHLTSIVIPDSVTSIGPFAFANCTKLTNVTIGKGVTSIGESAFSYCNSLTNIVLGANVITIGQKAFEYCDSLTSVTISKNVATIKRWAFNGCRKLKNITVDKNNPNYKVVDGHLYDKNDKRIV